MIVGYLVEEDLNFSRPTAHVNPVDPLIVALECRVVSRKLLGFGETVVKDKGIKGDRVFVEEMESLAGGSNSGQGVDEEVMTDVTTARKRYFVLKK